MACGVFKDLNRRELLLIKKYDGYQRGLASLAYKSFDKKNFVSGIQNIPNKKIPEELHKQIIRNFNKRKVHPPFIDNIWGADLADTQLINKVHLIKGIRFLSCIIDIDSKYAWVILLKDKIGITTTNAFQKILDKSKRKPNKIWIDKSIEFYIRSLKSWSEKFIQQCIQLVMKEDLLLLKDS